MQKKNIIYTHAQDSKAIGGIDVIRFPLADAAKLQQEHPKSENPFETHRDEYYIFALLTQGNVDFVCDMEEISASRSALMVIKPYQVHSVVGFDSCTEGYFLTAAPFLIPSECNTVFQNLRVSEQVVEISDSSHKEIIDTAVILYRTFLQEIPNKQQIVNSLFISFVYRVANLFTRSQKTSQVKLSQPKRITLAFQHLVSSVSMLEQPSFFARRLNVTTSHLNDCVKDTTGNSVTYWLQDKMITEAKRQLYYTNKDAKEISFDLGFEDHSYFSRLFKKITGETPLSFRNKFRE